MKENHFSKMLITYSVLRHIRLFPVTLAEKQAVCSILEINIRKENIGELKSITLEAEKSNRLSI